MKKAALTIITSLCLVCGFSQNPHTKQIDTSNNYVLVNEENSKTYKISSHKSKDETIIFHSDNSFFTSSKLKGTWALDYDDENSDKSILTLTYLSDNEQVVISEKKYYVNSKLISKRKNIHQLMDISTIGLTSEIIELVSIKSKPVRASF